MRGADEAPHTRLARCFVSAPLPRSEGIRTGSLNAPGRRGRGTKTRAAMHTRANWPRIHARCVRGCDVLPASEPVGDSRPRMARRPAVAVGALVPDCRCSIGFRDDPVATLRDNDDARPAAVADDRATGDASTVRRRREPVSREHRPTGWVDLATAFLDHNEPRMGVVISLWRLGHFRGGG